jgi:hypothetical protein
MQHVTHPSLAFTKTQLVNKRFFILVQKNISALSIIGLMLTLWTLGGCVGPPALRPTVIGYDRITNQVEQELMLLNIARMHHRTVPHFTVTGSIAATFDFTTSAGASGRLEGSPGTDSLTLNWGASASENPTFSIIPISGQEFTKRLVSPMPEEAFATLAFQSVNIQLITRLMAEGIELQEKDGRFKRFIANNPFKRKEYEEFRRLALHLAGLQNNQQLFIRKLIFDQPVIAGLKWQPTGKDLWQGSNLRWTLNADGTWKVTRKRRGRTLISNYDTIGLSNQARFELNQIAEKNAQNFITIDIHPDYPGGDLPIFGAIKLRSLYKILAFIGNGIEHNKEYEVAKAPQTPQPIGANPRETLAVRLSDQPPADGIPNAYYLGKYYQVADSDWDRLSFIVLNILLQITVTDVSQVGIPITISK